MKPTLFFLILTTAAVSALTAQMILIDESFSYADGPLSGKGEWSRGVTSPSADNPSINLIVDNEALLYDWTVTDPVNNALRWQWEDILYDGWVYAQFSIEVLQAPARDNSDTRPSILHFDRSGGSQMRGHVGLQAGPEPGTFQVGISSNSQQFGNFVFAEDALEENTAYQIRIGYDVATAETWLWINPEGENPDPNATATGSPSANIRRIQLKFRNQDDSADGISNLGIFKMDDLLVYAGDAPGNGGGEPEPVVVHLAETFAYAEGSLLMDAPLWSAVEGSPEAIVLGNAALPFAVSNAAGTLTRTLGNLTAESPVFYALSMIPPPADGNIPSTNIASLRSADGLASTAFLAIGAENGSWKMGLRSSTDGPVTWSTAPVTAGASSRWIVGYDPATGMNSLYDDTNALTVEPLITITGTSLELGSLALHVDENPSLEGLELRNLHVTSTRPGSLATPIDLVTPPAREKFLLFLLAGQSNMAGRGDIAPEDLIGNRRILVFNKDRQWEVARDPLHWDRPGYNGVGPALSFARDTLGKLPDDVTIGLIPAAQGGTSIQWWQKDYSGTNLYYGGQTLFAHAVDRALEAAQDGDLTAILWNQGENDAGSAEGDNGASYREDLHTLIADFRSDLGSPDLPFIASTLGPWRTNADALNAVYLELPALVPNTAVINTNDPVVAPDLVNNPSDTPHYLSPSYRLLGSLYALQFEPFLPLAAPDLPWEQEGLEIGQEVTSAWFGTFRLGPDGWLNHETMGWINVASVAEAGDLWTYSEARDNWLWSNWICFPVMYDFMSGKWIQMVYLGQGIAYFYDAAGNGWVSDLDQAGN